MMRVSTGVLAAAGAACTAVTVANAFLVNKQFYPAIVYLTKSSSSMAVLYTQGLVLVYLLFQAIRRLFFGELRASESEHLSERAWHAVMEMCLAFTVFRDDFSPIFVMQFVLLLFIKSFHWLGDDRVDMMERSPVITIKFHMRMMAVVAFLGACDSYCMSHAYFSTLVKGASSQIVFGFEYAICLTMVIHITIKYMLHMHDLRSAHPWDNKAVYLLYAELFINTLRCILYGAFMLIMLRIHTFPLFTIRPFYMSLRSLQKAFTDVVQSRRAINAMNNRFPLATAEELASMDATCIICREEMTAESGAKRLPCSHVFHAHCLRSWFQRQQTCPTCRTDILGPAGTAAAAGAARQAGLGGGAGAAQQQPQPPPAFVNQQQMPMFPFVGQQFAFGAAAAQQQQAPPAAAAGQPGQPPAAAAAGAAPVPPPFGLLGMPFPPPPPHPTLPGMPALPPMMFPGMMPPLPPLPPPPAPFSFPPPPSTAGLSDDELRAIEGHTRQAVEARVRVLQDISTLLDAAVLMMQQYATIAGPMPSATAAPSAPSAPAPSSSDRSEAESSGNASAASGQEDREREAHSTSNQPPRSLFGSPSSSSLTAAGPSTANAPVETAEEEEEEQGTSETRSSPAGSPDPRMDEIRQRRLQRFADSPGQSNA